MQIMKELKINGYPLATPWVFTTSSILTGWISQLQHVVVYPVFFPAIIRSIGPYEINHA